MDPMFPHLPADLAVLTDEDLAAAVEERLSIASRIHARDAEVIGDRTAENVIDEMTSGVEQIETLRAEQAGREQARLDADADLEALAARAGVIAHSGDAVPDEEADDEDDSDDGDAEAAAEAEPALVAATDPEPRRRVILARSQAATPIDRGTDRRTVITAASDVPGFSSGAELPGLSEVAEAMIKRARAFRNTPAGMREDVVVASITRLYDEEETLQRDDLNGNWEKIQAKVGRKALVASGGLCAPETPYYDLAMISVADRPVRDSLPRFNAARGGIRFAAPPKLSAVTTGVGLMTAANDAIGGTTATKTCQHITCPNLSNVDVDMIYWCLQFGNLSARAWPEQVAQFTELTMAAHAREAETVLLDGIAAASTATTVTGSLGASASLLSEILVGAAAMRSRHRMAPDATLRVLLPEWADDMLVADLMRSQFQRFEMNDRGVEALLRSLNVVPTYYLDSATAAGQVFGAQAAGALLNFPTTVVWYLYPEGSFLWLDAGTLDLGIVRDSVLNSTNDFSVFGETFENIAFIGVESIKVTSTICASGIVASPVTVTCPVA